jgi:hypothetical protein
MTPAFIAAVADTLLPGDPGGRYNEPPLPPASAAGIDLISIAKSHGAVFEAIARQADSPDAFAAAAESARIVAVQSVERAMPDAFRALLSALLAEYYESPVTLTAMDWRVDPPQPHGHELYFGHPAVRLATYRVHNRGKLWRG